MSTSIGERLDECADRSSGRTDTNSDTDTDSRTDTSTDGDERTATGGDSGPVRSLMRVVDSYYTEVDGADKRPVTRLCGRTFAGDRAVVTVDGHRPHFFVSQSAYEDRAVDLRDDRRVVRCRDTTRQALDGTSLVRVETRLPTHVSDLRDHFERTWEADVRYDQRVLVDVGASDVVSVPKQAVTDDTSVSPEAVRGVDLPSDDVVPPRVVYFDIEVATTDLRDRLSSVAPDVLASNRPVDHDSPAVVSETGIERAANEVIAISAYDSLSETYALDVLAADWSSDVAARVRQRVSLPDDSLSLVRHNTETSLLERFCRRVTAEWRTDVLAAFNAPFDVPYLVNRCYERDVYAVRDLSPTGDVRRCSGDGSWINSSVTGVHVFDLLKGYEKTRYQSLDSYALADVAATELDDVEKLAVDEQRAYVDDPVAFCAYALRDTRLLVDLDDEVGII